MSKGKGQGAGCANRGWARKYADAGQLSKFQERDGEGGAVHSRVCVCVLVKPKANIDRQSQMQKEKETERERGG